MKKSRCYCVRCGEDITQKYKFYQYGYEGGAYCYFCAEAEKKPIEAQRASDKEQVNRLHGRGYKPSQIAHIMQIPPDKVYGLLNERKKPKK